MTHQLQNAHSIFPAVCPIMAQLVAELRAFLQEHHRALKSFCTPAAEAAQRGVFWLEEHDRLYPERVWNVYQLRDVRDALSALCVLARVSSVAWWEEAKAIWPTIEDVETQDSAMERVGMIIAVRSADSLLPVKDCVEGKSSAVFQALSARILNALGDEETAQVRVPIQLDLHKRYHRRGPGHKPVFEKMVQFVQCLKKKQDQSTVGRPFIAEVSVRSLEFSDASQLSGLLELMHEGVTIDSVPRLKGAAATEMSHRRSLLEMLLQLMSPYEMLSDTTTEAASTCISIDVETIGTHVPALMSAIAKSRSLQSAYISFVTKPTTDVQARRSHLRWLAYGLFSVDANHAIESVNVDAGDLTIDDVEIMSAVANSIDPLFTLFDLSPDLSLPRSVIASRFYLTEPKHNAVDGDFGPVQTRSPVPARILGQEKNFWKVLLPGFRKAWVNVADPCELVYGSDPPFYSQPLSRVSINATKDCSNTAILGLLQLFGRRVRELELNVRPSPVGIENWVLSILEACPRLEMLKWASTWSGYLSVLTKKATNLPWNLHTLTLNETRPVEKEQLTHFLDVLSDNTHPFTAKLRALKLHINMIEADLEAFATMFGKMMDANRRLALIQLHFSSHIPLPLQSTIRQLLKKQSVEVVQVPDKQLPVPSKLAFLSVFSYVGQREGASYLSEDVISSVFEYAGGICTRQFRVTFRK